MSEGGDTRYRIGQLAQRVGVSTKAIRFYEQRGILPEPARTDSGYRWYSERDVDRLQFVLRAKAVGLSLPEIADIVEIRDSGRVPCVHVRQLLDRKFEEVSERIRTLERLQNELDELREVAESIDVVSADDSCYCHILQHAPAPRSH